MSKEILQNTPPKEIARQEGIHELIYTEEDYVRDLNLLDEVITNIITYNKTIKEKEKQNENVILSFILFFFYFTVVREIFT